MFEALHQECMLAQMVQDVVEVEDATTLMPPFPTDQELMVDWHMLTNEEIEEARESHLNHIVKETIERLVYSCERNSRIRIV